VPAFRAVIPGTRQGDRAEHGIDDLVPVAGEHGLVLPPARDARPPVAAVGGQDLAQHARAETEQPGAGHLLRRLHPGIAAAQDPGSFCGEPG